MDAHEGLHLRSITESPITEHIDSILVNLFIPEHQWHDSYSSASKKKKLGVMFCVRSTDASDIFENLKAAKKKTFEAIRRSGDRGKTVLNRIGNLICWCWVLAGPNAFKFADPTTRPFTAYNGRRMARDDACEGDDSILGIVGLTEDMAEGMHNRWIRLGHEPNIFWRKPGEAAEFCGWKFIVSENGPDSAQID